MTEWKFYRNGKIVPITEDEARHTFDRWGVLSDDRGMACLMHDQLWAEIDRLRAAIVPAPEDEGQISMLEKALAEVPNHFMRENDFGEEPVWEICRYGFLDEPEIVVVCGYARQADAEERIYDVIARARAKSVLTALRDAARGAGG